MGRKKKMKAVNDLHAYRRGPKATGKNWAPDVDDLVPEDMPSVFSKVVSTLPANTGALSKASQRKLKQEKLGKGKRDRDELELPEDDGEGPVPIPIPKAAKSSKKETPAAILPGESYAAFARRVNKEATENLAKVSVDLQKPLQKRKKEYLERKKLKKKKGKKTAEEDEGRDFVHTDKVRFGEQAQAPPKLNPPNFKKKKTEHVPRDAAPPSALPPELEALRKQYIDAYRASRVKERAQASGKV